MSASLGLAGVSSAAAVAADQPLPAVRRKRRDDEPAGPDRSAAATPGAAAAGAAGSTAAGAGAGAATGSAAGAAAVAPAVATTPGAPASASTTGVPVIRAAPSARTTRVSFAEEPAPDSDGAGRDVVAELVSRNRALLDYQVFRIGSRMVGVVIHTEA